MKFFATFVVLLALASVASAWLARDNLIREVNTKQSAWTAGVNTKFAQDTDYKYAKRLCGSLKTPENKRLPIKLHNVLPAAIPATFDSRQQWPMCPSINEIRDQSDCGSCWAFGAVEAGTDRICIETKGAKQPHLAATDLLSCCDGCGSGCDGGYPSAAWDWFTQTGVVTGGNYNNFQWCVEYPLPICDHHVNGTYQNCANLNGGQEYNTPNCPTACDSNSTYKTPYQSDKHIFATAYGVASDVQQIQTEIMTNGPVEAAFTVYADFVSYKSGVYYHVTGDELGGHAIKILGWGTEGGIPYWLVANSWNVQWGAQGYFKIRRGTDECGIEDGVVAGLYTSSQ
jgi:cathepsin B